MWGLHLRKREYRKILFEELFSAFVGLQGGSQLHSASAWLFGQAKDACCGTTTGPQGVLDRKCAPMDTGFVRDVHRVTSSLRSILRHHGETNLMEIVTLAEMTMVMVFVVTSILP